METRIKINQQDCGPRVRRSRGWYAGSKWKRASPGQVWEAPNGASGSMGQDDGEVARRGICDRRDCSYIGPMPSQSEVAARMFLAGLTAALVHVGCPLLILTAPVTFPIALVWAYKRAKVHCPACERGEMVALSERRGQRLRERAEQQRRR